MSAADYVCKHCGASGVKLWRKYQTFLEHQELTCVDCTQKAEGRELEGKGHSIGWRVLAVPDETGSYWGYTSIPQGRLEWWDNLPLRNGDQP